MVVIQVKDQIVGGVVILSQKETNLDQLFHNAVMNA